MFPHANPAGLGNVPQQQPKEFKTEPAQYVFQKTLVASTAYPDQSILIDGDAWFYWQELFGSSTGAYSIQFKLPSGRWMSSAALKNANAIGTAQFPVFLDPVVKIRPNGKIGLDITDTSGAGNTVEIVLSGYKVFAH